jgi:hypothetical protein
VSCIRFDDYSYRRIFLSTNMHFDEYATHRLADRTRVSRDDALNAPGSTQRATTVDADGLAGRK